MRYRRSGNIHRPWRNMFCRWCISALRRCLFWAYCGWEGLCSRTKDQCFWDTHNPLWLIVGCWHGNIPYLWRKEGTGLTWWRHPMETFSASMALCAGNSPVTDEFSFKRPVTLSFDVFLYLRLNKRLSKQSRRRWFETPSRSLWRHCDEFYEI